MEYCAYGNLRDWIAASPLQGEAWAREVARQILSVLAELATVQLAHRNIKPSVCAIERNHLSSRYMANVTLEYSNRFRDADSN